MRLLLILTLVCSMKTEIIAIHSGPRGDIQQIADPALQICQDPLSVPLCTTKCVFLRQHALRRAYFFR